MDLEKYRLEAKKYPNVSVYRVDENNSLGKCLNFAVYRSRYPLITKFDDDDYYTRYYVNGIVSCFQQSRALVLGKNTCYVYLKGKRLLLLFRPNQINQYKDQVMGSTLSFRRHVFNKVRFRDVSQGEDTCFFEDCLKHNIKIYSCDPFNYVCIRRQNRFSHTWTVDEKTLLEHSKLVARTMDFTRFITRVVRHP